MTDGMPLPGDLPHGDCQVTRLDDGSIRIDRADPRILISAELIAGIVASPAEYVELDLSEQGAGPRPSWSGGLLKITGTNRRVVYRIREYIPHINGYIAEMAPTDDEPDPRAAAG